ncbi:aminopeptidase P family protein [Paraburkholderia sp. Ac-20342]|uniref:M24 family metallopeptidase n=1 Tax=Paraburkholderia sp. Ac-20342 TaxID=2703889 RepID=UPI00197D0B8A|nr:Xaa-Pro peptidase family protein [Paraburkholderia sp. Ac-20342]MBN3851124.1 aminopeptidase P family protein [Paraburkholderia sp. Ac-20342]
MSAQLHQERSGRLRRAMADAGLDLLVVPGDAWHSDYLRYALDLTPMEGEAIACIERDGAARVFVASHAEAARFAAEQPAVQVSCSADPLAQAEAWIAARGAAQAALVAPGVAPTRLAQGPLGAGMTAATAWFDRLMVRKSAAEADAVARATALADAGYAVFRDAARVGCSEYELIAEVEAWFRSQGCPENFVILGTGGREVRGMHPPGDRRIAAGDLVTTELTPCVDGYYAQICRTLVVGEPTDTQLRAYAVYREALEAGIAAVRPGATHGDVARAQNDVFRRHGLGDYVTSAYTRVRGHGVGLFVDGPHVLENVELVLEPDMTLIVHPNTYHPEAGYMVLGDTVRVTASGCDVLTGTTRDLISVPA